MQPRLEKLVAHPGEVVYILADALPGFSNFYINYIFLRLDAIA